jgi:hypothetical protein
MNRHGVFSLSRLVETDHMRDMLFEHAVSVLTQPADQERFMLFPLGIPAGPSGLLSAFKVKGAVVAPRA